LADRLLKEYKPVEPAKPAPAVRDNFLRKFTDQPLLLSKPDLNQEIKFVKKIIDSL
jgi:hypothetical protein